MKSMVAQLREDGLTDLEVLHALIDSGASEVTAREMLAFENGNALGDILPNETPAIDLPLADGTTLRERMDEQR